MKANLSVIVTNYNKTPQEIEECFQSILDQTVQPEEIIFVDDHSDSVHIPREVLTIVLPKNVGVAKARDVGVRMSRSKLLLFVDADDKLGPDFIERCGKKLRGVNHPGADIVYSDFVTFGAVERNRLHINPTTVTPEYLMGSSMTILVTSIIYKEMYEKLGGFRELSVFEDWDFWLRAMVHGYTFAKADTLLWYRQSKTSRGNKPISLREDVHKQITAPFRVQEGKLVWEQNGQK